MFSVNLTSTALHDEHLIKFVELCLAKAGAADGHHGVEIDSPIPRQRLATRMSDVAHGVALPGLPDRARRFRGSRTECFALLRLPGVRYVKLAPQITSKMRTDRGVRGAAITAIVQMARVLGMHTVAKRTDWPQQNGSPRSKCGLRAVQLGLAARGH